MSVDKKHTNPEENDNEDSSVKPEPETLHKTDPQKNMEGPVSSLIRKTGEGFTTDTTKKEADDEKEENLHD